MLLANGQRTQIEREILPDYIRGCRWFGAKARTIRAGASHRGGADRFGEERGAILVPRSELYRRSRRKCTPCRCKSRLAKRLARFAATRRTRSWRGSPGAKKPFCTTRFGMRPFAKKLFRLMSTGNRLHGKAGELIGISATSTQRGRRVARVAGAQRRAEQYVDGFRQQVLRETLSQTRRRRESGCGDHAISN